MFLRTFIFISLGSLLLASCTAEDTLPDRTDPPENAGAIRLEGVLNGIGAGTRGTGPIVGTKPSSNLSLSIYRADATSGTTYGSVWSSAFTGNMAANTGAITLTPAQYYLTDPTRSTKLIALHPASGEYNAGNRTVTYASLDGGTDIMYGAPVQGRRDVPISSAMTFTHLLTQVRVKIVAANNDAIGAWGNVTGVTIANKKTGCIVQLPTPSSTDPVSVRTTGTTTALALTNSTGGGTGSIPLTTSVQTYGYAMFLPVTAAETLSLNVTTAAGGTQTLPVGSQKYEAGKAYEITINFTARQITATATLTDWNENPSFTFGVPSNCYMLKPGGHTVAIPVGQANGFANQLGENESFTAQWLWADAPNLITVSKSSGTGYKDYIHVTSGAVGNDGNAVVVMKNTAGEILWSWHIWVTDYEPDENNIFMDRDLGAKSIDPADGAKVFGLLYQGGRKDPFPGAGDMNGNESTIYTPNSPNGITYNISVNTQPSFGFVTGVYGYQSNTWTVRNPGTYQMGLPYPTGSPNIWPEYSNPCPAGWTIADDIYIIYDGENVVLYPDPNFYYMPDKNLIIPARTYYRGMDHEFLLESRDQVWWSTTVYCNRLEYWDDFGELLGWSQQSSQIQNNKINGAPGCDVDGRSIIGSYRCATQVRCTRTQ